MADPPPRPAPPEEPPPLGVALVVAAVVVAEPASVPVPVPEDDAPSVVAVLADPEVVVDRVAVCERDGELVVVVEAAPDPPHALTPRPTPQAVSAAMSVERLQARRVT